MEARDTEPNHPVRRRECGLAAALALVAGGLAATGSWVAAGRLPPRIYAEPGFDVWFDADIPRVIRNMTDRGFERQRTQVHPLVPMVVYPPTAAARGLGLPAPLAIRATVSLGAGLWAAALFITLRVTAGVAAAVVFTALGCASAAAVFWLPVPETRVWGSFTLLCAVAFAAIAERRCVRDRWLVATSAASLAITVSNWMAGIIVAFACRSRRRAASLTLAALAVVTALWAVQRAVFPGCVFFLGAARERVQLEPLAFGRVGEVTRAFWLHSIIAPVVGHRDTPKQPLTFQASRAGSGGGIATAATLLWLGLLVAGVREAVRGGAGALFRRVLLLVLGGQFVLHLAYGGETFLYSLHFAPLLMLLASFGANGRHRRGVLGAAVVLTILLAITNGQRYLAAAAAAAGGG